MKKVSVSMNNDLIVHLEALKLYYGYSSRAEVVRKALDELIDKHATNEIFGYYVIGVREILCDREVKE